MPDVVGCLALGGAFDRHTALHLPAAAHQRELAGKLIRTALRTEVCLAFPALDVLRAGYEVFPVVDAVGGTSPGPRGVARLAVAQVG
jgi:hypothetical protein